MSKYLSCAEVGKLIRQIVKEAFPGVKFSVAKRASGSSISVRWTDGPNSKQVEAVIGDLEGSYFDGMIDYKGSRYHTLDGEKIHLGADFIFCERECSDAVIARAIGLVAAKWGANEKATVAAYRNGELWNLNVCDSEGHEPHWNWQKQTALLMQKISDRAMPSESATRKRIRFVGDCGYGAGTVGQNGEGGSQCYLAMSAARERQEALAQIKKGVVLQ